MKTKEYKGKIVRMSKKQLIAYDVITDSKKAKESFNKVVGWKETEILGTFKNCYGELFVLLRQKGRPFIDITGDEFGWEFGNIYLNGAVFEPWLITKDEIDLAEKALEKVRR